LAGILNKCRYQAKGGTPEGEKRDCTGMVARRLGLSPFRVA